MKIEPVLIPKEAWKELAESIEENEKFVIQECHSEYDIVDEETPE